MIINILKYFMNEYSELVKEMKESNHHLDNENLNPFHLEGDVWTHTMMVLNYAVNNEFSLETQIAALLHDIGKPKARFIKDETKVAFFGHEAISTVLAVGVLNKFEQDLKLDINKEMILKLINFHSDFHKIGKFDEEGNFHLSEKNKQTLNKKYGDDLEFYINMIDLNSSDNYGRFYEGEDKNLMKTKFETLRSFIPQPMFKKEKQNMPEAIMLSGLPGVGKSKLTEELLKHKDYVILSSDNKIMERYPKLSYSDAYHRVVNKDEFKIIEKEMREELLDAIKKRKNIIFDRMNVTKKSRNRWFVNVPHKYYKKVNYFIMADIETIYKRNKSRKEKEVPQKLYDFMMNKFTLTTFNEEFDEIKYVFNEENFSLKNSIKNQCDENIEFSV